VAVLIIAPARDEHAVAVKHGVEQLGAEASVLDTGLVPEGARLVMQYHCCRDYRKLRILTDHGESRGDGELRLERYGSVWWRRPQPHRLSDQMLRSSHREFAANETMEAMAGLWQTLRASWINEPLRDQAAHRKAYQLRVAQEVGLKIPATLITNDPAEARRFADARGYRDVIYKSFSSTETEWRETRLLREEEVQLLDHVRHAPVIFQHYVPARYDLRITVVGEQMFPAAIHSQQTAYAVDSRVDISAAKVEAVEIPTEVQDKLQAMMRRLDLVYGAVDMRLTPEGEYVFLELNPAGQFLYIEAATGLPIVAALASELQRRDLTASSV
jgi:glutathione synthase/RimK-type ligase-like ATP-grasp enzyme